MKHLIRRIAAFLLIAVLLVAPASALTVDEALDLLDRYYVYDIPEEARDAETLDELFSLLGEPYTYYMDPGQYSSFLSSMNEDQSLVGIGISVELTEQGILILESLPNSPARRAGLQPGDLIVKVNGVSCVPATPSHQALIAGEPGTFVTLSVLRGDATFTHTLIRSVIIIPNVDFSPLGDGVYSIRCSSFGLDTGREIAGGLSRYDSDADFWLLDLRSNSGGYSEAAVDTLGAFAGENIYLYLRDEGDYIEYYSYSAPASSKDPVIVLVNGGSASASEAVAAGIRDLDRGLIIGSRTFGKGVAQVVLDKETHPELFEGDALKITAFRFYSQGANSTDLIGVIPTLLVEDSVAPDLARALCGKFRDDYVTEGQLMLKLDGQYFFINIDGLTAQTAAALLSALPPTAQLWVGEDEFLWKEHTSEYVAELLGIEFRSRWFDDVAQSPFAGEINTLATYSLLLGDGTGSFLPQHRLTRAQACAMLAQMLGITYSGPAHFTDVPDTAWYADEVNTMAALGLVEGVGDGKFLPDAILSQQEYYTILGRMARFLNFGVDDYARSLYDGDGNFTRDWDPELAPFAHWARESVAVLSGCSTVLGSYGTMLFDEAANLSPTAPITREQAAACLCRMLTITGILPA